MRDDAPSFTAIGAAVARGFTGASRRSTRDPIAERLLPRRFRSGLLVARRAAEGRPGVERLITLATFDLLAHAGLRSDAIDAAIADGVVGGARQLVILGAGLDSRAYRLASLHDVRVFEVDHPATQRFKTRKTRDLRPLAKEVVHVAVDFGRDSLALALTKHGHDAEAPSIFVWEGVTMYLSNEALRSTLAVLGDRATPGSVLALTYIHPAFGSFLPAASVAPIKKIFAAIGEPLLGLITTDALHREVETFGFRVRSDTSSHEWQEHAAFGERPIVRLREHLTIAERIAF